MNNEQLKPIYDLTGDLRAFRDVFGELLKEYRGCYKFEFYLEENQSVTTRLKDLGRDLKLGDFISLQMEDLGKDLQKYDNLDQLQERLQEYVIGPAIDEGIEKGLKQSKSNSFKMEEIKNRPKVYNAREQTLKNELFNAAMGLKDCGVVTEGWEFSLKTALGADMHLVSEVQTRDSSYEPENISIRPKPKVKIVNEFASGISGAFQHWQKHDPLVSIGMEFLEIIKNDNRNIEDHINKEGNIRRKINYIKRFDVVLGWIDNLVQEYTPNLESTKYLIIGGLLNNFPFGFVRNTREKIKKMLNLDNHLDKVKKINVETEQVLLELARDVAKVCIEARGYGQGLVKPEVEVTPVDMIVRIEENVSEEMERLMAKWSFKILQLIEDKISENRLKRNEWEALCERIRQKSEIYFIKPKPNEPYNPGENEPVMFNEHGEPNRILQVVERGFRWRGKVMQKAKVVVST